MFGFRLVALVGVPSGMPIHPDSLRATLTREQWLDWEQFYEQDPWGELRADMRAVAHYLFQKGSEDVSPFMPYYGDSDEELIERKKALDQRKAELDPATLAERMKKARELHFANKKKANG